MVHWGTAETIFTTLGVYFAIVLAIGFIVEKYVKNLADYILGGRRLGPYVIAFSERASEMSGWVGLGLPSEGFTSGINSTWNTIGCFYADLMCWTVISKRIRRFTESVGALTIPTYLEARLGEDRGVLRITSALIIVLFLSAYVGAQFLASGKVFSAIAAVSGISTNLKLWIAIGAIVMIIYTVLGGFFAVCWTDYVQGWWAVIGLVLIVSAGLAAIGGPSNLFNLMAHTQVGKGVTLLSLNNFWGYGYGGALLLVNMLSYIAIGFGWPGNPHITVRFMGIKRPKDLKKAALTAMVLLLVVYYLAQSVGWIARVTPDVASSIKDPEEALPMLALKHLNPVLAGVVLAAPIALMMSTADSQLLVAASAIVEDIYRKTFKKSLEEARLVLWSRVVTLIIGIAALIWALFFGESVYYFVLFAWGGLGAAFGPIMLLSVLWRRLTPSAAFATIVTGASTIIIWKSYSKGWIFCPGGNYNAQLPLLAASVPIIVFVVTFIGAYLIERSGTKGLKAAAVAALVTTAFWVPWVYIRYFVDPKYSAWWYELLIGFPTATVVAIVTSYFTTPAKTEHVERVFRLMETPTPSELEEARGEVKEVAISEIDYVKNFIFAKGLIK